MIRNRQVVHLRLLTDNEGDIVDAKADIIDNYVLLPDVMLVPIHLKLVSAYSKGRLMKKKCILHRTCMVMKSWYQKLNERRAVASAIAASTIPVMVFRQHPKIVDMIFELPLVVHDHVINEVENSEGAIKVLRNIGAFLEALHSYMDNRTGPLLVYTGDLNERIWSINGLNLEFAHVNKLDLLNLTVKGSPGRFIIWTKSAIEQLDEIYYVKAIIKKHTYKTEEKCALAKYLIPAILPHLKRVDVEQQIEKNLEATIRGISASKMQVQEADCNIYEWVYCDICGTSIFDFHRSCSDCSFELCLACCRDIRKGNLEGGEQEAVVEYVDRGEDYTHSKTKEESLLKIRDCRTSERLLEPEWNAQREPSPKWKVAANGSILCPPAPLGGCGTCYLELKCILSKEYKVADLVKSAEKVMELHELEDETKSFDESCSCTSNNRLCPTITQCDVEALKHFQNHWRQGEPVIVSRVLENTTGLSWEPMSMCRAIRKNKNLNNDRHFDVTAIDCLDISEVPINVHNFFDGYLKRELDKHGWPRIMKLKDWSESTTFESMLPRHGAQFLKCLPFQDYTQPRTGYLNIATKLPKNSWNPELGIKTYIAYGMEQELGRADSVTKLHCNLSDAVNVLTHTHSADTEKNLELENIRKAIYVQDMTEIYGGKQSKIKSETEGDSDRGADTCSKVEHLCYGFKR